MYLVVRDQVPGIRPKNNPYPSSNYQNKAINGTPNLLKSARKITTNIEVPVIKPTLLSNLSHTEKGLQNRTN